MAQPTPIVELNLADPGTDPAWVSFSARVLSFDISRGRSNELDQMQAGRATVTIDDPSRELDPSNLSSPHVPFVVPMCQVRIAAETDAVGTPFRLRGSRLRAGDTLRAGVATIELFRGFVETFTPRLMLGERAVEIACTDAFSVLALAPFDYEQGSQPDEPSGTRIARVLDSVQWPDADRRLDEGRWQIWGSDAVLAGSTVIPVHTSALQHLLDVAATDGGVFFIGPDGAAVFQDGLYSPGLSGTWGDGAGENQAYELVFTTDIARLANIIEVTDTPALVGPFTRVAATSIGRYFARKLSVTVLAAGDDPYTTSVAEARADELIASESTPRLRISELRPRGEPSAWPLVLGRDLGDLMSVRLRPAQGTMLDQLSRIEGISVGFAGLNRWGIAWRLSAIPSVFPNLLTVNQQSLETDTTGWVAEGGCSISRSTAAAKSGLASLLLTIPDPPGASDATVVTTPANAIAVTPGVSYRAAAYFRPVDSIVTAKKPVSVEIDWRTSGGAFISTSAGTPLVEHGVAKWRLAEVEAEAPGTAAAAVLRLRVSNVVRERNHYVDLIGFTQVF